MSKISKKEIDRFILETESKKPVTAREYITEGTTLGRGIKQFMLSDDREAHKINDETYQAFDDEILHRPQIHFED